MAIKKDTLDGLLAGRDPQAVFAKDGAIRRAKESFGGARLNAERTTPRVVMRTFLAWRRAGPNETGDRASARYAPHIFDVRIAAHWLAKVFAPFNIGLVVGPKARSALGGKAYFALAMECRISPGLRSFLKATAVGALSAEAVRKGDVQEPMQKRGWVCWRFGFSCGEGLMLDLIAWMSGCTRRWRSSNATGATISGAKERARDQARLASREPCCLLLEARKATRGE
jgi:hypothetical protein